MKKSLVPDGISKTLSTEVLMRAYPDKNAFKEIWTNYRDARHRSPDTVEPTKLQFKIMARFKESRMRKSSLALEMKLPFHVVFAAINKVAVWEYLNS